LRYFVKSERDAVIRRNKEAKATEVGRHGKRRERSRVRVSVVRV
jgi:hypothetical protein